MHETELFNKATFKIFVKREIEKRIDSLVKRDNISSESARSRDKAISFEGIKYDYVISNNGNLNDLKDKIPFIISEMLNEETCLYAGSFDPLTRGHLELIKMASKDYDYVFVGIGNNPNKKRSYDKDEMRDLINDVFKFEGISNALCFNYEGYTGEAATLLKVKHLIRGIRNKKDEKEEKEIEKYNYEHYKLNTKYYFIEGSENVSSTSVREKLKNNESVEDLVPLLVNKYLYDKR